jgi:hypothetical protein
MTRSLRLLVLLTLVLLATPLSALAAEPYEGRWAEDLAWCRNTRASGTDEMPITITRRSVETFASFCRVLSAIRTARAMWRLRTSCRDEGQTEKEPRTPVTFLMRVDGNSLYLRDNTGVQNFTRCPP